ncbi:MAG: methylenetetrahydrofolate reductase [NAD(P)H] [Pseudonocardiales bacterium]|nr:methylenetetrahydrofolate reductase [NAD(P)H] [Pseudonocardiales bacterium]MBV9029202.1 methylenetetrahydrofolate reductase [NAD(P)H] [Pseudonocardiales bacterium]
MTAVIDRLGGGRPVFSVEFFPPRDDDGERQLWQAVREFEPLNPAFVSVTYGAGGSSRDRTVRITGRIAQQTGLVPMAHLTAVNHSVAELRQVIDSYAEAGIHNVLALRGDPPGEPLGEWVAHPQGVHYAAELVRLVRSLGDFCIGVAAFPECHPRSPDAASDVRHLVAKLRAGAQFAITQMFFRPEDYLRLRDRVSAAGADMASVPIVPGVMPITALRGVQKMAELSGCTIPQTVRDRLVAVGDDPAAVRQVGVEVASELCERLLAEGAPGLHFYTLNRSRSTRAVLARLGMAPVRSVSPAG